MTSQRESILKAVRANRPPVVDLPSLEQSWMRYDDATTQFVSALESVGGTAVTVEQLGDIPALLQQLPQYTQAQQAISLIAGVRSRQVEWNRVDDPHALSDLDFALLPACFGVAENAAVWVPTAAIRHRAVLFICQHLALVMPAGEVVHTMHEAYRRLSESASPGRIDPEASSFGVFVSGPSKTADIEQSLVIGAHGPRSLTVLLVQNV